MPQQNTQYGSTGVQGNLYQLKLLMMFLYRGVTKNYSFRIGPEIKEAGKFDDLVFEYEKDGSKFYRLLQAKHKLKQSIKINAGMLLKTEDNDFSLVKYFLSYHSLKGNTFFEGSIENVILYTNISFNTEDLDEKGIKIEKLDECDDILDPISDAKLRNVKTVNKKPCRYKFEQNLANLLVDKIESCDYKELAKHLAECVLQKETVKPKAPCKAFRKALCAEVIDVKNEHFFDEFIENKQLSPSAKKFRNYFEEEIETQSTLNLTTLNEELKAKTNAQIGLSLNKNFYRQGSKDDWPNLDINKKDIIDFLDHLIFAVDQPNEDELGEILIEEMSRRYVEDTRQIYLELQDGMLNLLKGKYKEKRFYTWKECIKLIDVVRCEIKLKQMSHFKNHLNDVLYTFERTKKLEDFISSSTPNLWLLPTETPWLSSLFLHQSFNTEKEPLEKEHYHNIKWMDLLESRGKFLTYFKDFDKFLIIITCLKMTTFKELMWDVIDKINVIFADDSSKKKIIVVASKNHEFMKQLEIKYPSNEKSKKEHLVIDLDIKSKTKLLNKKAICFARNSNKKNITQLLCFEGQTLSDHQIDLLNLDTSALEILLRHTDIQLWDEFKQNRDINSDIFKADTVIKYEDLNVAIETSINDIFVFLGDEKDIRLIINLKGERLKTVDEIEATFCTDRFILLNNQLRKFNYLCHLAKTCSCGRSNHIIHALKIEGSLCMWLQTYSQHFYIPRFFNPLFTPDEMKGLLVKGYSSTFVVFSGLTKRRLMLLLHINSRTDRESFEQNCVVKISERSANKAFNAIKRMMGLDETYDSNVPYLRILPLITTTGVAWIHVLEDNGNPYFEWIQSAGDCSSLLQYKRKQNTPEGYMAEFKQRYLTFLPPSRSSSHLIYNYKNINNHSDDAYRSCLSETYLTNLKNQLVVIADEPGMGKSTTFIHLESILEEKQQLSTVVSINLNKHHSLLISEPFTEQSLIESLLYILPCSKYKPLIQRILAYKLKFRYQVVLLCDGFDEMTSENQESVLKWIKFVIANTKASVWITTRLKHKETLENGLSVLAYSFESLVQRDSEDYLSKFWETTLMFYGKNSRGFNNFRKVAEKVSNHFIPVFGINYNHSFITFPFMLRILAEKYIEVSKEVLIDNILDENLLKTKVREIKAWDVYDAFVHQKYEMYFNNLEINGRLDKVSEFILRNCYSYAYRHLAAEKMHEGRANICCSKEVRKLLSTDTLWKIGLVQKYSNNELSFIHPSFGEYFAFEFLCNKFETSSPSLIVWEFLLNGILVHSFSSRLFEDKLKKNREFSNLLNTQEKKKVVYELLLNQVNTPFRPVALWNAAKDKLDATIKFLLESVQSRSNLERLLLMATNRCTEITNENIEYFVKMCLQIGPPLVETRMVRNLRF